MQHKIAELEGALLDAAVAKARGWDTDGVWCTDPERPNDPIKLGEPGKWAEGEHCAPSTRWQDGGPIIEKWRLERLTLERQDGGGWSVAAMTRTAEFAYADGATQLEALMRAYVSFAFGDTVELS